MKHTTMKRSLLAGENPSAQYEFMCFSCGGVHDIFSGDSRSDLNGTLRRLCGACMSRFITEGLARVKEGKEWEVPMKI